MKPAKKIGAYEVLAALGSGGAGTVYRARSERGEVAIKVLHRGDAESFARFDRERRYLAGLGEREGFVPLLDAGTSPGGPYIVMPLLAGGTLRSRLESGRLTVDETIELGRRLARALGHAHERSIIHRDVKPENVLFTAGGRPLLADLGLAKHFAQEASSPRSLSLSKTGVFKGTAGYMPPEQMRDGKSVGPPADVFALGAVLYECLAGQPAFLGETPLEIFAAVENGTPAPLAKRRPDAPPWLVRAIETALARAPERRFKDGASFAEALDEKPVARSRVPVFVAGAVVLSAAGVAAALALAPSKRPPPAPVVRAPPAPPVANVAAERDLLAGFREGSGFKLETTWGSHDWKHGAAWLGMVVGIAISPDGTRAITGAVEPFARLWDLQTGHELWAFQRPGETFAAALAFSPHGDRVVVGSTSGRAYILDAATGDLLRTLHGHEGGIGAADWSPDGKWILTGGGAYGPDNDESAVTVKEWDARTGDVVHTHVPRNGYVNGLRYMKDSRHAVEIGGGGFVLLIDLDRGTETRLEDAAMTRLVGLSVAGKLAATANNDRGFVTLFDIEEPQRLGDVGDRFQFEAFSVALAPDGKSLLGAGREGFKVWSLPGKQLLWRDGGRLTHALAVSSDGRRALSGSEDGVLHYWDLEKRSELGKRQGFDGVVVAIAAANGKAIGVTRTESTWEVREIGGSGPPRIEKTVLPEVWAPSFSRDGSLFLVFVNNHPDRHLLHERFLYDARTSELKWHRGDLGVQTTASAIAPNRRKAIAGNSAGGVSVFDLESGDQDPGVPYVLSAEILAIAFSDDSDSFVVGDARGGIAFSSLSSVKGTPVAESPHKAGVTAVAASGRRALSGDTAGVVVAWDASTRRPSGPLVPAHAQAVTAVALEGRRGATASVDGTVALWDVEKRERIAVIDLSTSEDWPTALVFETNRLLRVGTARGVVHTFQITR